MPCHLTVYDITRAYLLDIVGKVERRGSLSVAEKLGTWFTQLFSTPRWLYRACGSFRGAGSSSASC